jgi:hypothetical protein
MGFQTTQESLIAQDKNLAAHVVRDSRADDVFTVIRMAPAQILIGPAAIDHSAVSGQIEAIKASQTTADLAGTLALVKRALSYERPTISNYERDVCFFTDLQHATWDAVTLGQEFKSTTADTSAADALKAIAHEAATTVVSLGPGATSNLAITNLASPDSIIMPGAEVALDVTLHQFGSEPRPQCKATLLVNDLAVAEQTIDVPAGGDVTAHFRHRFQSAGTHAVCVRTAPDPLKIDNARWLIAEVRGELRVLCVAGRDGAASYLKDALNPDPTGPSTIRPVVISDGDFADAVLADYDCVFLCNVAQLTANEAERLARYARGGGGVVIFLGDRTLPEKYNALTSGDPDRAPLLPAQIGEVISKPNFGIDPLGYRHPIVAAFRGRERAGLLTTPISRYHQLTPNPTRKDVEVAAALPDGSPFIIAAPLGRGRVVLVATDASTTSAERATDEPWTTWPTWPSFLPLVRELLSDAMSADRAAGQLLVGNTLGGDIASAADVESLQIARPDGETVRPPTRMTSTGIEWSYGETNLSGIYTANGSATGEPQRFAVNVDTAESDLTKLDSKLLPPQITTRTALPSGDESGSIDAPAKAAWDQSFLWGVLALMLAESYLARHFGRGAP